MKIQKIGWANLKAATECNYKEIDRQLKEQFVHGLIDSDISIEIKKSSQK